MILTGSTLQYKDLIKREPGSFWVPSSKIWVLQGASIGDLDEELRDAIAKKYLRAYPISDETMANYLREVGR